MPNSPATVDGAQVADLQAHVVRLQAQVAALEAERARLEWAVGHDELTGLPNRRLFHTLAPRLLDAADDGRPAAVMVLDLNGFKPINDRWGHHVGDHVLRVVARRLATTVVGHLIARIGGDEFAAVLTYPVPSRRPTWWRPSVEALCGAASEPLRVAGHTLTVTASVGIAPAAPAVPIDDLLRRADQAMYLAKAGGQTATVQVWQPGGDHPAKPPGHRPDPRPRDARHARLAGLPAPTIHPNQRDPAQVSPASAYQPDDPVWVYRDGGWRTGVVDSASPLAIMATYRRTGHGGTGVDTMTARYVLPRADTDPDLDRSPANVPSVSASVA